MIRKVLRAGFWAGVAGGSLLLLYLACVGTEALAKKQLRNHLSLFPAPESKSWEMPLSEDITFHRVSSDFAMTWRGEFLLSLFTKQGVPESVSLYDVHQMGLDAVLSADYDPDTRRFHKLTYWPKSGPNPPYFRDFLIDLDMDGKFDKMIKVGPEYGVWILLDGEWVLASSTGHGWVAGPSGGAVPVEFADGKWRVLER